MNRSSLPQKRRPPNSLGEHRKSSAAKFGIISAMVDSIESIPTWNFQVAFNRKSVFFAFQPRVSHIKFRWEELLPLKWVESSQSQALFCNDYPLRPIKLWTYGLILTENRSDGPLIKARHGRGRGCNLEFSPKNRQILSEIPRILLVLQFGRIHLFLHFYYAKIGVSWHYLVQTRIPNSSQ